MDDLVICFGCPFRLENTIAILPNDYIFVSIKVQRFEISTVLWQNRDFPLVDWVFLS